MHIMKTKTNTFEVSSGVLVFGDPCYDHNESCKALNGPWTAHVVMTEDDSWGRRVKKVVVHHVDFNPAQNGMKSEKVGFSVDSGQAGVFDHDTYGGELFYNECCKETLSKRQWGYLDRGFVTSSGYGDGWYEAEVLKVGGKAVCLELNFLEG